MTCKAIPCDTTQFTVHEMSVADLRAWYQKISLPGEQCDLVNENAALGINLEDLALICQCEVSAFDSLTARELNEIAAGARELNPHFFKLRDLIIETMFKILDAVANGFPSSGKEAS